MPNPNYHTVSSSCMCTRSFLFQGQHTCQPFSKADIKQLHLYLTVKKSGRTSYCSGDHRLQLPNLMNLRRGLFSVLTTEILKSSTLKHLLKTIWKSYKSKIWRYWTLTFLSKVVGRLQIDSPRSTICTGNWCWLSLLYTMATLLAITDLSMSRMHVCIFLPFCFISESLWLKFYFTDYQRS